MLLSLLFAFAAPAAQAQETPKIMPAPHVLGMYSSWPSNGYRYRTEHDELVKNLGWAYTSVENVNFSQVANDLDRYDIFLANTVYNYENPQPLTQYREQWLEFLNRGGIILALDCNYGQMIDWINAIGPEFMLMPTQCQTGMNSTTTPVTITAPDDPFAPNSSCTVSWSHFTSHGSAWKVLAQCDEGNALVLRANIGKGVLIAANTYGETNFPDAEYLQRIWAWQYPRIMDTELVTSFDWGAGGVGQNSLTMQLASGISNNTKTVLHCYSEIKKLADVQVIPTQTQTGLQASKSYSAKAGSNIQQVIISKDDVPLWWTNKQVSVSDILSECEAVEAQLAGLQEKFNGIAAASALSKQVTEYLIKIKQIHNEAQQRLSVNASEENTTRWNELAGQVKAQRESISLLAGRAEVFLRVTAQNPVSADKPFVVVRSEPLAKLHRDQVPAGDWQGGIKLAGARGEGESVQVAVVPLKDNLTDIQVKLEPLRQIDGPGVIDPSASELFKVCYVNIPQNSPGAPANPDWWPDPLLPADRPFPADHVCRPVWVDLFIPRDAPAGEYTGDLIITAAGHEERVPLRLTVWDFALPEAHSLRQYFVFRGTLTSTKYFGGDPNDYKNHTSVDKILNLADVAMKRRLGVQIWGNENCVEPQSVMPWLHETRTETGWTFDWTDTDRILQHMWDSGMRTLPMGFMPGCGSLQGVSKRDDYYDFLGDYLPEAEKHFREKGWLDAGVFYMADEGWAEDAILGNIKLRDFMEKVAPDIKRLATAPRDPRLYGVADVWVPGGMPESHPKDADWQRLLGAWKDAEQWWYICCGPTHPYPNFFIDYPTIDNRMVFWLTWKYNKTGFLYWGIEYHGDPKDMTWDGPTKDYYMGLPSMGNGDGTLCYWGPDQTMYPSIRLNAIRDGIEDYEYFAMLRGLVEQAEGKGLNNELVAQAKAALIVDQSVIKDIDASPNFEYNLDGEKLLASRNKLARLIVDLTTAINENGAKE